MFSHYPYKKGRIMEQWGYCHIKAPLLVKWSFWVWRTFHQTTAHNNQAGAEPWPSTSDNWNYVFVNWPLKVIENKQNVLLAATLQLGSVFASYIILHPAAMRDDGSGHVDSIL